MSDGVNGPCSWCDGWVLVCFDVATFGGGGAYAGQGIRLLGKKFICTS